MPSPGSDQRASSITTRDFALRRKGFDPDEVRAYLGQLAEMVGRLTAERDQAQAEAADLRAAAEAGPIVDEDQLTAALGEETARVLSSARHAANEMRERAESEAREVRERAEESAARVVREATEAAAATRQAAEEEAQRIGEETRRAQEAADEAGRAALAQATADAEQLRSEAAAEAARLREEAEAVLGLRTQEAEAVAAEIRAAAETDAAARATEAEARATEIRAAAEEDREAAQAQGREMVAEAQRVRERMLADLARRRKAARVQLEQLQGARDRLLDSYDAVQRTIDEATAGLRTALPAARTAAEAARLRAEAEPEASIDQLEAQIAAARDAGLPLVAPAEEPAEPITDEVPITQVEAITEPEPEPDEVVESEPEPNVEAVEPEPEPEIDTEPEAVEPEPEPEPEAESEPEVEAVEPGSEDPADDDDVDDIFARLKASRDDAEPEMAPTAEPTDGAGEADTEVAAEVPDPVAADEVVPPADDSILGLLERRDGMIEPIETRLARRLKRVLADEQGQVLDAVRRARGSVDLDEVLPAEEQAGGYAQAGVEDLRAAAEEGAAFEGASLPASAADAVDRVAEELGRELAGVVRPRVARCFEGGEDPEDTSDRLRAAYREWKTDRLVEVTRHLVLAAFGEGQGAVRPAGVPVRWVTDPDHPACPDCEDDALAGAVPSGQAFPTGHAHPPAHPGCRCLVVGEQVAAPV